MNSLDQIFGINAGLSWWQECARGVVIFVYGLALVRIAGRRVFGKWSAIDIIVSIIVGSNLSRALTGSAQLWGTLAATTLIMLLHWALAKAAAVSPGWSALVEGRAIRLSEDGRLQHRKLVKDAISRSDIDEALRQSGVESVESTRLVTLEPSGKITVLK